MAIQDGTRQDVVTRGLLRCGVAAGPLFVLTALTEGAIRADYRPLRHPVSSLALGSRGWVQVANFSVTGALYLGYAAGMWRAPRTTVGTRTGPILIGAAAVGLLGAAAFVTDPVSGYPPGTPSSPGDYTTLGALHDLFSIPTFLGLPAAGFAFGRWFRRNGDRGWAIYSTGSGLVMLIFFGLASAGFSQVAVLVDLGGLFERAAVTTGLAWLTALAIRVLAKLPGTRTASV
jgi:Protein of unknown function (DUF998)